jgi:hypothetical protein
MSNGNGRQCVEEKNFFCHGQEEKERQQEARVPHPLKGTPTVS